MPRKTNTKINDRDYFRVRATVGKNPDGSLIRKAFYGTGRNEAIAKRDEYLAQIKNGLAVNFDKDDFGAAFKVWLEDIYRPSVSQSSYNRFETEYRLRIAGCGFCSMRLVEIRTPNIQAYYNGLLATCTPSTVHSVHKVMASFFKYALEASLITKNPLKGVKLPAKEKATDTNAALSDSDIDKLKRATREDMSNFIYLFAVFSGLREGEILALRHKDIDMTAGTINVNKSMKFLTVNGAYQPVEGSTKTKSSIRTVPILPALKPFLKAHISNEMEKHFRLGIPFSKDKILFSSTVGTYREAANVLKQFKRLCNRLGIEQATFHSLRHTFCTMLAKQGVPLKTASVLMGHSDIGVTAKVYTHVDDTEKKKGIERLAAYF